MIKIYGRIAKVYYKLDIRAVSCYLVGSKKIGGLNDHDSSLYSINWTEKIVEGWHNLKERVVAWNTSKGGFISICNIYHGKFAGRAGELCCCN
jgi:Zn-dependent oligopeptidase